MGTFLAPVPFHPWMGTGWGSLWLRKEGRKRKKGGNKNSRKVQEGKKIREDRNVRYKTVKRVRIGIDRNRREHRRQEN